MNQYATIVVLKLDEQIRVVEFHAPYGNKWEFDLDILKDSISSYIESLQDSDLDQLIVDVSESMGLKCIVSRADFVVNI